VPYRKAPACPIKSNNQRHCVRADDSENLLRHPGCRLPEFESVRALYSWRMTNAISTAGGRIKISFADPGAGQNIYVAWLGIDPTPTINAPHTTAVGRDTNATLQNAWVTTEVFTFSASMTVTLPQASFAGQALDAIVCQDGTGGHTATGGLTITGTFPTFTTTVDKCGDFSLVYTSPTRAYITRSTAGPL